MSKIIEKQIVINSLPSVVWEYLTNADLMKKWMGEPEMNIEVQTDWVVSNPIIIKGFHHVSFENTGRVLQFVNQQIIQYSHLSSVSKLSDTIENHTIFTFLLTPSVQETLLTLKMENFPTETIFKHLDFYWQGTLTLLKDFIEKRR